MCFWSKAQTRIEMHVFLQCEGDYCHVDLPQRDPSSFHSPYFHPLASGQHVSAGPCPEGRGSQGTSPPLGIREDSAPASRASAASPASLHPVGGEPPSGCGFTLPAGAGLASGPQRVSAGGVPVGKSTSSRRASRRNWRVSCHGEQRISRRPSTLSAWSGTSAWPSSSLPFPSSRGLCGSWRCRGGCTFSSPHTGKPRRGSPVFSLFQSWKSAASPSTMLSWSTSRRGNPLRLWNGFF